MIIIRNLDEHFSQNEINESNAQLLKNALWIDLINPTKKEESLVEQHLKLNIPTREEMLEIELSSRLYKEHNALFMTASMIEQSEATGTNQDPVTFVLTKKQLITLRYFEPQAFKTFSRRLQRLQIKHNPIALLTELLDITIDGLADLLEIINHQLEKVSKNIFQGNDSADKNYHRLLQDLGQNGELTSKIVESLVSFNRLLIYFDQSSLIKIDEEDHVRIHTLSKDINSLSDHCNFLSNKISFLLEATLGMVQIEQNRIIKIFSVAAVIFLPPTLIASIYGMNFHFMPELKWKFGYLYAFIMMIISSWLPYKYFKYRKWL